MKWDSRRSPRKPITVQIRVQVNPAMKETIHLAKESIEAELVDISTLGVGLVSDTFLPPGALVDFDLPREPLSLQKKTPAAEGTMRITGQIVHARSQGNGCRMGLAFTQIEETDRDLIRQFIC